MIIVTGGAGFIGSCIIKELNEAGHKGILIVDEKEKMGKCRNIENLKYTGFIDKSEFIRGMDSIDSANLVIHMGACTTTTEKNVDYMMKNNYEYSKKIFDWCAKKQIRLIYASSAAVYGDGSNGCNDSMTDGLKPLNAYGESKRLFDRYVLSSHKGPPQVVGLRFFNVYGPNEYHKGTMASVVFHSFNQIKRQGKISLFRSYKKDYKDGEQKRDFVYVKDVVSVVMFMMENKGINGIFNVGTGKARSFNDLAKSVFKSLDTHIKVEYIDMPEGLAEKYQYFTEAKIDKLRKVGYNREFFSLESGVKDYVRNYLSPNLNY